MVRMTVAICTWNRARLLATTLETVLAAQARMQSPAEVIVVNNNCTDETDSIIWQFAKRMRLQRVFEPKAGVSHARNAAIEAATGDYIVWTDDDVLVDSEWLISYEAAFRSDPDASFFGGPITPQFEGEPPTWLLKAWATIATAYATRDFGDEPFLFEPARLPFGANFAMRTTEQKSLRYDPRFGRQPSDYWLGGDELQVLSTLLTAGRRGWWVPNARVRHWIPRCRQTTAYLRQYFAGWGRTMMIQKPAPGSARPVRLWLAWVNSELRYRGLRMTAGPETWMPALVRSSSAWGMWQGSDCRDQSL